MSGAKGRLAFAKELAALLQSVATILAIIVGGAWTYITFIQNRESKPRMNVEHRVTHRPLGHGKIVLFVDIRMENTGKVKVSPSMEDVRVYQVLPLKDDLKQKLERGEHLIPDAEKEAAWPHLAYRPRKLETKELILLEPGERAERHHEFILEDGLRMVMVYSHYENPANKGIGWDTTSYYDVSGAAR
ncbi:MAG: hypothetical protein FJW20_16360 [Acidimicrobiia bacterium]|nr:hypothetical protein [Acidimicrobiia bacterium]